MGGATQTTAIFLPWLSLAAIIWLQSLSGTSSDFSGYSSELKSRLGITQVQLNYMAVASDAGKLFGWCSGIAAAYVPLPFILLIGAAIGLVAYGIPFLFLTHKIATLSYTESLILSMLAGNSLCWINTACYVASMRKFPANTAATVGLSTSYSALSAMIYIALSQVIHSGNDSDDGSSYLLLNSVAPMAASLAMAPLLANKLPRLPGGHDGFVSLFVIALATGVHSVVVTVVPVLKSHRSAKAALLVMVAAVAAVPLFKAFEAVKWPWGNNKCLQTARLAAEMEAATAPEVAAPPEVEVAEMKEHGIQELLVSVDFWLYFGVYLCGGTLGLVYMNNLGQISQSRGVGGSALLSISSSFGFFGKLLTTAVPTKVSRPLLMMVLMCPMAASFFLLLDRTTVCLFIGTAVIGMCSGAMTSVAVSMTAELFGREHFGVNHNVVIVNIPIGSLVFGYIAGFVYDREGMGEEGEKGTCMGFQCYDHTFMLWGWICLLGTVLSLVLCYRTRRRSPVRSSPV